MVVTVSSGHYMAGERWNVYVDGQVVFTMIRDAGEAERMADVLRRCYEAGKQNTSYANLV